MSIMVHAHLLATRVKARHFRGEMELEPLIDEKHYDFNYQDYWHFNKIRKIMPGDQVTVECYYNTSAINKTTLASTPYSLQNLTECKNSKLVCFIL